MARRGSVTIDASGNNPSPGDELYEGSRIFNVDDGNLDAEIDIAIDGLTLSGGEVIDSGGAIRNLENLSVTNSDISGNIAGDYGGGIYSGNSGLLFVARCVIDGNYGRFGGGGINAHNVVITDSTIRANSASGFLAGGGGIKGTNIAVTNCTISGNEALGGTYSRGGGIVGDDGGILTVSHSSIIGNLAAGGTGGGIFSQYSNILTVTDSTISGNSARFGGGIYGTNLESRITVSARARSATIWPTKPAAEFMVLM